MKVRERRKEVQETGKRQKRPLPCLPLSDDSLVVLTKALRHGGWLTDINHQVGQAKVPDIWLNISLDVP